MLEAITFNQKSKAQVEAERVAELRKANEEEKLVEANEISEIILGNVDVETGKKDEKEPNEQKTKRAEDLEAEQQLKLQHFSAEEKFEEVVGDNGREKMNVKSFSVRAAEPHDSRDTPHTNVVARESDKEMKKRKTVERAQARCWRYDKRQRDQWKVWFNSSTPMTLRLRDIAESLLNVEERNQILEKDKGLRFNKTQRFTIGPEYFLAQSYCYPQLTHVTESKSIISAIAKIPKKSLLLATYSKSMMSLTLFGVDASRRKELSIPSATSKLLGEFFHWRDVNIATQGEVEVAFDPNGLFQPSNSGKNQQTRYHHLLFIVVDKKKRISANMRQLEQQK
ncbi:hypothetical protein QN277_020440 [Acacia crassicarpa]|uniref:Uncharacterized protein n=1 Tax=Acacia crassicarpa TaxID=499986 RepID=A0AAE1KEW8_9FABA|nr:hypothetical protein QN277_020440 [Acacia crassicarpa]